MTIVACSACSAVPHDHIERISEAVNTLEVSVPSIHCAGCISKIERGLTKLNGVLSARVNLSLKRVSVVHDGALAVDDMVLDALENLGFEGQFLDGKTLARDTDGISRDLLIRLGVSGFAAMNVMLLSVSVWAGAEGTTRDFLHWVSAAIALPTVTYTAQPFFKNALSAVKVRRLNMDVPISLAIIMACGLSLYETILGGQHAYFDAALSLTFFLLAGRFLDHQTRAKARSAAVELTALEVPRAQRLEGGRIETVDLTELDVGQTVLVRRGARVPVDGTISKGIGELDTSLLTGETMPHIAKFGDVVYAGTLNLGAPFELRITHIGQGTKLAEIAALVAKAETTKTKYTNLADKAARIYAPLVHLLALVAFLFWQFYSGDTRLAVGIATAVLIITCPCALGLAVPAVMTTLSGILYRAGVLITNSEAIERLGDVDTVVFDKTGTLTTGQMEVLKAPKGRTLRLAASLASQSDHPLSVAIARMAEKGSPSAPIDVVEYPGLGVSAIINGVQVRLGRAEWFGINSKGDYVQTWVKIGDEDPKAFLFEDKVRASSKAAIELLQNRGLKVVLISGDAQSSTDRFAAKLGIETCYGNVQPCEKLAHIQSLGDRVLMVGDGLNDTAALSASYVSMSPATAIDAARAASDFVLIKNDLTLIDTCIDLSKSAKTRMLQNFGIAAAYNFIAVPVALMGFATPLLAALAMSASSICVSLNALRLK